MKPSMPMDGKIVKQDKCRFCKGGSYVAIIPTGEEQMRIFHSKTPACPKFDADVNAYWRWHNMSRDQRRAAKSKKNGRAATRRRR
jgi:hypothetical protein